MSNSTTFSIEGMTCGHCEAAVVKAVKSLPNVKEATAFHKDKKLIVTHDGDLRQEDVRRVVQEAGYTLVP